MNRKRVEGGIIRLLVVIKVDRFAKLLDITTYDEISGHAAAPQTDSLKLTCGKGVGHLAWPRSCFCNPKIQDVVKRIRMIGTAWEGQVAVADYEIKYPEQLQPIGARHKLKENMFTKREQITACVHLHESRRWCKGNLKRRRIFRHVSWRDAWSLRIPGTGRSRLRSFPFTPFHLPMASRCLGRYPSPPVPVNPLASDGPYYSDMYSPANPYHTPLPHPPYTALPVDNQPPAATLRGGTLLHRVFLRSTGADPDAITLSISLGNNC